MAALGSGLTYLSPKEALIMKERAKDFQCIQSSFSNGDLLNN